MSIGAIIKKQSGMLSFYIVDGEVYKELEQTQFYTSLPENIYFLPESPDLMVYDIEIPTKIEYKNIELVLCNELSYLLPVELDDVRWGYKRNTDTRFSIYVLKKEHFDSCITFITNNNLTCDYLYPMSPETSPEDLCKFVPVTMTIPKEIRPVRNKAYRVFYFVLLIISAILCGSIFWNKYAIFHREYITLKTAIANKNKEFKRIQHEFGKLMSEKELLVKIRGLNLNMNSLLPILHELNAKLPKHMWITNYVQHSNIIDLTIQSSQDEPNFFRHLSLAETFKIINLRKSRSGNSTVIFYAKLQGSSNE